MIRTPTVFILGAGASAPYGFPQGFTLAELIYRGLRKPNAPLRMNLAKCLGRDGGFQEFADNLAKAGRSIDAFLEKRQRDATYSEIGRAAIAHVLMPFERDDELNPYYDFKSRDERRSRRWYHYLFDKMLTRCEIEQNNLSVITFNFDRSFERALYLAVEGNYGGSPEEIAQRCRSIQVIHVHGALGGPAWLEESANCRSYGCSGDPAPFDVMTCAQLINIVFDDVNRKVLNDAQTLIREAKRVCFLGFSYHHLNVQKLAVDVLTADSREVVGTAFKMGDGSRYAVEQIFTVDAKKRIDLHPANTDILDFLESTPYVHER